MSRMENTSPTHLINVIVNGRLEQRSVLPRQHLIDFLRDDLGLKGSHVG